MKPSRAATRPSGTPFEVDVVVGRVGGAAGQPSARPARGTGAGTRRSSACRRAAGRARTSRRRTRASGSVAGRPVEALLDVGLLADDAGLEDGEVGRRGGRELCGQELGEVAGEPGSPGQVGQVAIARLTEVWKRRTCDRSAGQLLDLDQHAGGLARRGRRRLIVTLTSAHSPSREVADGVGAVLGRGEEDPVVVGACRRWCCRRCRRSGRTCRRRSRGRAGASPWPG